MTHQYRDDTKPSNVNVDMSTHLLQKKVSSKTLGNEQEVKAKDVFSRSVVSSSGGRSRFRPTYLSGLNLSALKLSSFSRLWLHDGQNGPLRRVGHGAMLVSAIVAAGATAFNMPWVQVLERDAQTFFFRRRGTVSPPKEVVIVEMDESSLSAFTTAEQGYRDEPERYWSLEPIAQWPWQRSAYAMVIDRLLQAGAKTVAVDVIIDQPSVWGESDDRFLQQVLQQYPEKVVLASSLDNELQSAGGLLEGIHPLPALTESGAASGYINYPIEPNGRIHRFSHTWLQLQMANDPVVALYLKKLTSAFHYSFAQRTVAIAQSSDTQSPDTQSSIFQASVTSLQGAKESLGMEKMEEYDVVANNNYQQRNQQIFFYGPTGETFDYESFWELLDPQEWERHKQQQTFRDKIVLIGPTAQLFQDFHRTPFGQMPGIEVHANAIATYLEGRTINDALPHPYARGIFVLVLTLGIGYSIGYPLRLLHRTAISIGAVGAWALLSYLGWLLWGLTIPTAVPIGAILAAGMGYVVTGLIQGKLKLRGALKRYVSSPIVQDIINQQDDLQDLISEKEKDSIGKKLDGRYEIIRLLGAGGFGQTFVAKDLHRPGCPQCVVKQLHPVTNDIQVFDLSRRLFRREAETLERLGNGHKQIPQLLAYFEEASEFYLVQELIEGRSLSTELRINSPYKDIPVILLLKELLEILMYVHSCGVIHRDIKPSNVIRRASDKKLVLIDFGAVKEMQGPMDLEGSSPSHQPNPTVCVGTRGYMPNEQLAGSPRFSSDIYAVGIIGIQASTKKLPDAFEDDLKTGELQWQSKFSLGKGLKDILYKMTRYDFKERYQSSQEALDDLDKLLKIHPEYRRSDSSDQHPFSNETLPQNWNPPSDLEANTETVLINNGIDANVDQSACYGDPTLPWPKTMKDIVDQDEDKPNR